MKMNCLWILVYCHIPMEHKEIQTHLGDWGNLLFIKSSRLGINEEDAVTLCSLTFVEFLQAFLDVYKVWCFMECTYMYYYSMQRCLIWIYCLTPLTYLLFTYIHQYVLSIGIIEKIQACEINITKTSIKIQVYQPTQLMIYTSSGWTENEMFNV